MINILATEMVIHGSIYSSRYGAEIRGVLPAISQLLIYGKHYRYKTAFKAKQTGNTFVKTALIFWHTYCYNIHCV